MASKHQHRDLFDHITYTWNLETSSDDEQTNACKRKTHHDESYSQKRTTMTTIAAVRDACRHLCHKNSVIVRNFSGRHIEKLGLRSLSSWSSLSKRDFAALEDRLVSKVASTVKDPILDTDLRSLGWIQRKITISDDDGSLGIQLKLPTLLHPERQQLTEAVSKACRDELHAIAHEKGINQEQVNVNVEVTVAPVIPIVARRPEEHDEVIKKLGPGLSRVAHFLAVYSCKVQTIDIIYQKTTLSLLMKLIRH